MDTCKIIQIIETTNLRRGKGIAPDDPVRVITQYWSLEGKLLWEVDPYASAGNEQKKVPLPEQFPPPWWLTNPKITHGTTTKPKGSYLWNGLPNDSWG